MDFLEKNIIKITDCCRACLTESQFLKPLLENDEHTSNLLLKFASVSSLKVDLSAGYPPNLCNLCVDKINQAYDFQNLCKESNRIIAEILASECHDDVKDNDTETIDCQTVTPQSEQDSTQLNDITCEVCRNVFLDVQSLKLHSGSHPKCSTCGRSFRYVHNMRVHARRCAKTSSFIEKGSEKNKKTKFPLEEIKKAINEVKSKLYKHVDCIFCNFTASSNRSLGLHMTRIHREIRETWCAVCNQSFSDIDNHLKETHSDDFKCPFCGKIKLDLGHFIEHIHHHSEDRLLKCGICFNSFTTVRQLKYHKNSHRQLTVTCQVCKKDFKQKTSLRLHMASHTQCKNCKSWFEDEASCQKHSCSETVNNEKPKNYCSKCDRLVRSLTDHTRKYHSNQKNLNAVHLCPHCGKQFKVVSKLNVHIRIHTGDKPYKCQYCDMRFQKRNNLVMHERTHTGEKPYVCSFCGKAFAQSSCLKVHSRIHTGRPEQCPMCEKRFCRPTELKLHMRNHTGEKPYSCHECGRSFVQRSHLVGHIRSHVNDKPFKCEYCGKTFKSDQSAKLHVKVHLDPNSYKCSQCPFACNQWHKLELHLHQHKKSTQHKNELSRSVDKIIEEVVQEGQNIAEDGPGASVTVLVNNVNWIS